MTSGVRLAGTSIAHHDLSMEDSYKDLVTILEDSAKSRHLWEPYKDHRTTLEGSSNAIMAPDLR